MPRSICLECITKLNQFNEFFTSSKENQIILEIIFGPEKLEGDDVKDTSAKEQVFIIEEIEEVNEDYSFDNFEEPVPVANLPRPSLSSTIQLSPPAQSSLEPPTPKKKKFDRFDCYVCQEQLSGNNKFVQHFKDDHPSSECRYTCFVCNKQVGKYRSYTRHIESHKEKRFSCDVCDRNFSQKITLAQHLNTHSNHPKLFKCLECGLEFKQNSSLFKHRKQKHSMALPACSECDKSFVNSETLQQHMRSKHNATKDITCSDCSKTFASRSALIYHRSSQHQRGSTALNNCKDCRKTFKTPTILSRHVKKFH